ncbi:hypothetical protein CBR_g31438 [Chara braunii]|uniref:Reverse transcriptase domain-containing protein n=1 Tax=Chara braunii TaxID=69332 RepID=A0A388LF96_CHABU|nr:hypothetical protein CBR_g31438 [Chara braunii]|eukprot:GBG80882.1 hypothetical protein CBR_g31438 [Chara braunii]
MLAINRLFAMSQGNTPTRHWLTEWQKIVATADLELPFSHLRRELYNQSCAALSLALGDHEQYTTFAEIIDKAREIIKTNRAAAHEKSAWQPTYVEKGKFGPRPQHVAAVQPDNIVEDSAATQASREGDQVAAVQPRSNNSRNKGKAKTASPTGNGQPAPWDYLHAAVPAPLMDAGVEVVNLRDYLGKIDRELKTQRSLPYGAPVLFVRKKNKDLQLCIDYHKLNPQTIKNAGPLSRIDDLLDRLGGAKFFSKLDLKSGYHQLEIRQEDRYKTAFKTRYGHFEWLVMPFGLTNAPTTFQAAMTTELRHMLDRFVVICLDNILVYSRSLDEHVEHLRTVLERLRQAKYKVNRDKCEFGRQELEYLGHYVMPQGNRPLADKIEAIRVWPEPTNTMDVRSFMGLAGYYQRFITGYSRIAAPMTRLQSPKAPFVFDDDARRSSMLMAPVLSIYDPTLPTRVTTDASGYGIGAVLEQHDGDDWHLVEYFSHKVPPMNSLDDARKKELLAFVMALKRWRHFLLGRRRFTWVTDNNPLTYHKTQVTVSSTIGRWMHFIDQFDFTLKHLAGLSNRATDALSRRPDLRAMTHHAFAFDEELQRHFIRGYESDPDFATLYVQLSSDHPPASHYRIVDGYLLLHSQGKDLLSDIDAACSPASIRKYRELLAQARANMQKAQVRMQQHANRRRVPCPIRSGDLVWVSAEEFALEQDVSCKLLPKWFGPWAVTSAAGDEPDGPSFVINIPPHLTVHLVFHASKLATYTPAKSDDFLGRRSQDPPSMDGHQEVDRVITDHKYGSKPRQYKVTFKACDPDDTQWISGADLKVGETLGSAVVWADAAAAAAEDAAAAAAAAAGGAVVRNLKDGRPAATQDLLLFVIAAAIRKRRREIIERCRGMDEVLKVCNSLTGTLNIWNILDDARDLVRMVGNSV